MDQVINILRVLNFQIGIYGIRALLIGIMSLLHKS